VLLLFPPFSVINLHHTELIKVSQHIQIGAHESHLEATDGLLFLPFSDKTHRGKQKESLSVITVKHPTSLKLNFIVTAKPGSGFRSGSALINVDLALRIQLQ
jgi:hypothetical protein